MKSYLVLLLLCALGFTQPAMDNFMLVETTQESTVECEKKDVLYYTMLPHVSLRFEQLTTRFPDPQHLIPQREPVPLLRPPTV